MSEDEDCKMLVMHEDVWRTNAGRIMGRCLDCNAVEDLTEKECNIEVGTDGKLAGILCDKCYARYRSIRGLD
jgi:hypothetical protein